MLKRSKLFLIYCLLFIFGIFCANLLFQLIKLDEFYFFIIILFLGVVSIIIQLPKSWRLIIWGICFFVLGVWRFGLSLPHITKQHVAYYNGKQIEFIGQVVVEPDIRRTHRKLTLGNIIFKQQNLVGKILVNVSNFPSYNYGDWLRIKCKLQAPGIINNFDYGKYLAVKNIYSVCYWVNEINLLNTVQLTPPQKFYQTILIIKTDSKKILDQTTNYPQNEILSAMILGLRKKVPQNILNNFSTVGLSHIIAISGLHISIVAGLLLNLFIFIGLKRRHAFYLAILTLFLFLLLIGFRASALRAGIMGFVALWALNCGRLNKSLNALLLAASILLLINPKLLLADIGFQLSFLAVLGIIYLGDYINKFLSRIKIPENFEIKSSLTMTLSAQIMVLPLIVYYFGNLSLISPLANILALPFLPFIMILGFIQTLAGFVFIPFAQLMGYLTETLISWIILVSHELVFLPLVNFKLIHIDLVWIITIYMLYAWTIWLLTNKDYEK